MIGRGICSAGATRTGEDQGPHRASRDRVQSQARPPPLGRRPHHILAAAIQRSDALRPHTAHPAPAAHLGLRTDWLRWTYTCTAPLLPRTRYCTCRESPVGGCSTPTCSRSTPSPESLRLVQPRVVGLAGHAEHPARLGDIADPGGVLDDPDTTVIDNAPVGHGTTPSLDLSNPETASRGPHPHAGWPGQASPQPVITTL